MLTLKPEKPCWTLYWARDPSLRQVALLDTAGHPLAQDFYASNSLSSQFINQLNGDILTQTSKGQNYIGPVDIEDVSNEPLTVIAVPVKNVFGDVQGTLVAEVDLKFMWDLVGQLQVGETGYAYVVDNKGDLIAFSNASRVLRGENEQQILDSERVSSQSLRLNQDSAGSCKLYRLRRNDCCGNLRCPRYTAVGRHHRNAIAGRHTKPSYRYLHCP